MSPARPFFVSGPARWLRWFSYERPAYFWSLVVAAAGPVAMFTVPPIRAYLGDDNAPPIPQSYPIPTGPRKQLTGFGDETEDD